MADIFVSYARQDKARVAPLVAALEAQGWSVWWDPEITPGQEFDRQISAALDAAKAVIVVWTPLSIDSRWVRGEAREAADRGILVPVRFEGARLPIDARAMHTTDLDDWKDDQSSKAFQDVRRALAPFLEPSAKTTPTQAQDGARGKLSICVLPFANMSDDAQQEYFADGISEDIITDLSKVSALSVISRNSAFTFKGKHVDLPQVARQLKVSHVLEGSVRKSGNRVRITAQLIDGSTNGHIWAERYDRDLSDIFALQDEISEAIVTALKVKLFPEEKKAIEERGTNNVEAYDLALRGRALAAQMNASGLKRAIELFRQAVALDPSFHHAWGSLMGALADYAIVAPEERAETLRQVEGLLARHTTHAPDQFGRIAALMWRNDFLGAERLFEETQRGAHSSNIMPINQFHRWLNESVGRFERAVDGFRANARNDPLSLVVSTVLQMRLDIVGRPDEAQAEYERSEDLAGDHSPVHLMAVLRMWNDSSQEAIRAQYNRFLDARANAMAVPIFEQLGPVLFDAAAARAMVRQAIEDPAYQDPTRLSWFSLLAGIFGDTDGALIAMRRAYVDMRSKPPRLMWHPALGQAHRDPRFKDVVRDLGLYDYWRKSGKWGDFVRPLGDDDFEIIR